MPKDAASIALPVVILGSSGSGKTSLVQYLLHKKFVSVKQINKETSGGL